MEIWIIEIWIMEIWIIIMVIWKSWIKEIWRWRYGDIEMDHGDMDNDHDNMYIATLIK